MPRMFHPRSCSPAKAAFSLGLVAILALGVLGVPCAPAATGLGPSTAMAQPRRRVRSVVLRFEGARAEQARRAVVDALAGSQDLVSEQQLIETASQIGVDVSTPEGMASVVEHLQVSLVLGGFIEGAGRRTATTVWVMDVRGNELARRVVPGAPGGRGVAAAIGTAAVEAATEAIEIVSRPAPMPEPPTEAPPMLLGPDLEHERPGDRDRSDEDVSGRWNQPFVRAFAGLRLAARSLAVEPNAEANRFDADLFPDLQLAVELRPFARDPGALRGLYAAVSGGFSVGLGYYRLPPNDVDPSAMQTGNFGVDLGYALMIEEAFELVLSAGFGMDVLSLADATLLDFPSAAYAFLRPAAQGRVRLLSDSTLVLELGLGARIGLDVGDLRRFGPLGSSASGLDLGLGLAGQLEVGFSWAARFAYTTYFLSFDGDPLTATSGTDSSLQLWLLVGWSF